MLQQNATRTAFAQRLQAAIDAYNSGATATDDYYEQLTDFVAGMQQEAERHVREGLTEDELELFDLLKKDPMTQEETQRVKLAAKRLLRRLVEEQPKVLVQDWFRDQQTQMTVRSEIERVLDEGLPESYERALFKRKCDNVFELIVDYANRRRKWAA
jgi:type I restriction enzyme R subunit